MSANPVADELRQLLADPLTARERDVLELLVRGQSNQEIADGLGLSVYTVKCHVATILHRLNAVGRCEAAYLAILLGLVRIEPGSEGARIVELRGRMNRGKE